MGGESNIHKPINVMNHINGVKTKIHMITPIHAKHLDNIQHPFMIRILNKLGRDKRHLI
jgi:hypothetical protein